MNSVSTNRSTFLGEYIDTQNQQSPLDGLLCGGLILFLTLLIICALVGGTIALVLIVCVLVLGCGLGIVLHYRRYMVPSGISDVVSFSPLKTRLIPKPA